MVLGHYNYFKAMSLIKIIHPYRDFANTLALIESKLQPVAPNGFLWKPPTLLGVSLEQSYSLKGIVLVFGNCACSAGTLINST